jgi:predicted branched-subunit amino acid permease
VRRVGGAHLLIDESTAMALKARDPKDAPLAFFATGGAVFVLWNLATLIGGLAGNAIGDTRTYGLDAAVPAAFLALLWPQLSSARARITALSAAVLALTLVPFTRPGLPIIAATGIAVLAAVTDRPAAVNSGFEAGDPGDALGAGEIGPSNDAQADLDRESR